MKIVLVSQISGSFQPTLLPSFHLSKFNRELSITKHVLHITNKPILFTIYIPCYHACAISIVLGEVVATYVTHTFPLILNRGSSLLEASAITPVTYSSSVNKIIEFSRRFSCVNLFTLSTSGRAKIPDLCALQ